MSYVGTGEDLAIKDISVRISLTHKVIVANSFIVLIITWI